jgi:hypothetical protein
MKEKTDRQMQSSSLLHSLFFFRDCGEGSISNRNEKKREREREKKARVVTFIVGFFFFLLRRSPFITCLLESVCKEWKEEKWRETTATQ